MLDLNQQRAHLLLREVYEKLSRHNNRSQLDWGVTENAAWQRCLCWMDTELDRWYVTPPEAVGRQFTEILTVYGGCNKRVCLCNLIEE